MKSEVGIDQATSEVNTILLTASKQSLKRAIVRRRCRISNSVKKKWFDKDCRLKRHEVRKLANQKCRDPLNTEIRISYHDILSEYKNLLRTKQQSYKNEKVRQLTESQDCSQSFWNIFKALPENVSSETLPPVKEAEWLQHFGNLHSAPKMQSKDQNTVLNELKSLENLKSSPNSLDYPISVNELISASKKQKIKKASYSDLIKNEMIKTSCDPLLAVYIKLFNLVLSSGIFPSIWCEGIVIPIFKSGDKADTGNYRGICVSSCLGKFFSTIINDRLLKFVESRNILHPSKIGFLKANRTSDHIFTLRTLIEKYC